MLSTMSARLTLAISTVIGWRGPPNPGPPGPPNPPPPNPPPPTPPPPDPPWRLPRPWLPLGAFDAAFASAPPRLKYHTPAPAAARMTTMMIDRFISTVLSRASAVSRGGRRGATTAAAG